VVSEIRDRDLKASLLMLIEWDHHARYGLVYDVRFLGSRMREWTSTCSKRLNSAGANSTPWILPMPCALQSSCSPSLARVSPTGFASNPSITTAFTARSKPSLRCIQMSARGSFKRSRASPTCGPRRS
jgi:hypothetical protein